MAAAEEEEKFFSNVIGESSKSQLEDFLRANQENVDKGLETSFKNLNTSLYNTINAAFSTFTSDYDKRIDQNREAHEKCVAGLNEDLRQLKIQNTRIKDTKGTQEETLIKNFENIQHMKIKSKVFRLLLKNKIDRKLRELKSDTIGNFLAFKKRYNIFNSWRNITNALVKSKIRLKYNKAFNMNQDQMQNDFNVEMEKLQNVLNNLENDIQREMDERRNLKKLYDLSMKKGVEAFIKETNYFVGFNSSEVPTPNERSFANEIPA